MDTCAMTRLLVPGFIVGMIVSSMAQSDLVGMLAAAATIGVLLIVQRVRGTGSACAIHLPDAPAHEDAPADEPASTLTSPN